MAPVSGQVGVGPPSTADIASGASRPIPHVTATDSRAGRVLGLNCEPRRDRPAFVDINSEPILRPARRICAFSTVVVPESRRVNG